MAFRRLRVQNGHNPGVKLISHADLTPCTRDEDLKRLISALRNLDSASELTIDILIVSALIFADDTDILDRLLKSGEGQILPSETIRLFREVIKCGWEENLDKYHEGDLTEVDVKRLGSYTNAASDIQHKISKGWDNYHSLKGKIASLRGASNKQKGHLLTAMIRSVITYAVESRGMNKSEIKQLRQFEDCIIRLVLSQDKLKMKGLEINMSDLRFSAGITELSAFIYFKKARFYGHEIRRENPDHKVIPAALTGRFVPEWIGEGEEDMSHWFYDFKNYSASVLSQNHNRATIRGNVADWLENVCKVPRNAIEYLAKWLHGEKYKIICREGYIKQILTDVKRGNKISQEQFVDRKSQLSQKNAVSDDLNTAENLFRSGYCFICDEDFDKTNMSREKSIKSFNKHFNNVHNLQITQEVETMYKQFQKDEKARVAEADASLLAQYQDKFRLAAPRGRTSRARKPNYKCLICNLCFQTSLAVMIKHTQDHEEKNYIIIGKIKSGAYSGKLVPEQQCHSQATGSTSFSNHYEFCSVIFPEDVRTEIDEKNASVKYFCRKCNSHFFIWDKNEKNFTLLSRRIKHMRGHEAKCKGGKKKSN